MRLIPFGTPSKTNKYVFPAGRLLPYLLSVAAGAGILARARGHLRERRQDRGDARPALEPAHVGRGAVRNLPCAGRHGGPLRVLPRSVRHEPLRECRARLVRHQESPTRRPRQNHRMRELPLGPPRARLRHAEGRRARLRVVPLPLDGQTSRDRARQGRQDARRGHPLHAQAPRRGGPEEGSRRLPLLPRAHAATARASRRLSYDRHCARCHLNTRRNPQDGPRFPVPLVILPKSIDAPWADAIAGNLQEIKRGRGRALRRPPERDAPRPVDPLQPLESLARGGPRRPGREATAHRRPNRGSELPAAPTADAGPGPGPRCASRSRACSRRSGSSRPIRPRLAERKRAEKALARVRVQIELGPSAG